MDLEEEGMEVLEEGEEFDCFQVRLPCGIGCLSHCVLGYPV